MPRLRTTAAWRISSLTALAYALGTVITFSIAYFFVAHSIRERSDAWLSGEAAVLARVSADTPETVCIAEPLEKWQNLRPENYRRSATQRVKI